MDYRADDRHIQRQFGKSLLERYQAPADIRRMKVPEAYRFTPAELDEWIRRLTSRKDHLAGAADLIFFEISNLNDEIKALEAARVHRLAEASTTEAYRVTLTQQVFLRIILPLLKRNPNGIKTDDVRSVLANAGVRPSSSALRKYLSIKASRGEIQRDVQRNLWLPLVSRTREATMT